MSVMNYIPPSRKLFNSRHRVTRQDLQNLTSPGIDWSTALDLSIDEDSSLISYAVPVVGNHAMAPTYRTELTTSPCTRCSTLSSASDDSSSLFEPDLRTKLQSNLSLESLVQENKRRISEHRDSLNLFHSIEKRQNFTSLKDQTRKEVSRLKYENKHLFKREKLLQEHWEKVRRCKDMSVLLIEIGRNSLYWFGLPCDLRDKVYQCCLYSREACSPDEPNCKLYQSIVKCSKNEPLAKQIYVNLRQNMPSLFSKNGILRQASVIETKLSSKFPGLHYHLKFILKLNLIQDFVKPLLMNSLIQCLTSHTLDKIGLELLDVIVLSMYYHELDLLFYDDLLFSVLEQCHFKFFSNDTLEVKQEIDNIKVDLIDILETLRCKHGQALIFQVA